LTCSWSLVTLALSNSFVRTESSNLGFRDQLYSYFTFFLLLEVTQKQFIFPLKHHDEVVGILRANNLTVTALPPALVRSFMGPPPPAVNLDRLPVTLLNT